MILISNARELNLLVHICMFKNSPAQVVFVFGNQSFSSVFTFIDVSLSLLFINLLINVGIIRSKM